jgi:hypothetical protein
VFFFDYEDWHANFSWRFSLFCGAPVFIRGVIHIWNLSSNPQSAPLQTFNAGSKADISAGWDERFPGVMVWIPKLITKLV